jgi:hypothetical protein
LLKINYIIRLNANRFVESRGRAVGISPHHRQGMRKLLVYIVLSFSILSWVLCSTTPVNPYQDYKNCAIDFLTPGNSDTTVLTGDTVSLSVRIVGATLFNRLALRIDTTDSAVVTLFSGWYDTAVVKRVFSTPDTIIVHVEAILQNKAVLQDSIHIVVKPKPNKAPVISVDLPESLSVEIGAACSASVAVEGAAPLSYHWTKDGLLRTADTLATLHIGNFQAGDTGLYRCIVSNSWGMDTTRPMRLRVKRADPGKLVFWQFAILRDTLEEGDSIKVRMDSLYHAPAGEATTVSFLNNAASNRAAFIGDSMFTFRSGVRDSGLYALAVVVSSQSGSDTAQVLIKVNARYCSLTLQSDSGSIIITPPAAGLKFRWHDSVSIKAVPKSGYSFFSWSGDASGTVDSMKLIVLKNMTIQARFTPTGNAACTPLTGGSLNAAIRAASPRAVRPKSICPAQGSYDLGTIKVWGTVRVDIE